MSDEAKRAIAESAKSQIHEAVAALKAKGITCSFDGKVDIVDEPSIRVENATCPQESV